MRAIVTSGVEIPEALIAREAQNHRGVTGGEAWAAAANALAVKALLLHRARELGLRPDAETDVQGRQETEEEALIRLVLETEVEGVQASEAECRRLYEANLHRFRARELYEASHILIEDLGETERSGDLAWQAAAAIIGALARGESFAGEARRVSACPSGAVGGSLGQMRTGDLAPELETELAVLAEGQVAPRPVRSRFGWHVLRLDRRLPGRTLPYEAVAERIRLSLEGRAWVTAATRYVADLAAASCDRGIAISFEADGALRDGSLTLGDFLRDDQAAAALGPWLAAEEPGLAARLEVAAEAAGIPAQEFVRAAVTQFVAEANDERWTTLISAAQGASDPALAALSQILRSKLAPARHSYTVFRRT